MKSCWICGAPAKSGEHIFKKSDLVRAYGKQFSRDGQHPIHIKDARQLLPRGPKARSFKYSPSLCEPCNNAKTQPFDRAYDTFSHWFFQNNERILRRRYIDFREVYGDDFEAQQRNLFRYFTKSLGCRLSALGHDVPPDLVALLDLDNFFTELTITFSANEMASSLPREVIDRFLGKGDLYAMLDRHDSDKVNGYVWHENISWLTIHHWYGVPPEPRLGSIWIANAQCVYLGSHNDSSIMNAMFERVNSSSLRDAYISKIDALESYLAELREGDVIERHTTSSKLNDVRIEFDEFKEMNYRNMERICARLEELASLKDGWLDGEGVAIREDFLVQVASTLATAMETRHMMTVPQLFPTPEGGVQAEWELDGWDVEIDFLPSGSVEAIADSKADGKWIEQTFDLDDRQLGALIGDFVAEREESAVKGA